ncbi:MAG: c-type cytochrome [Bryobacterales bacterium]|nr:c-type cytochrome [Bryobacterales bacterium]
MKKNKYLLLLSSAGTLLLLGAAAVDENFLKEWRRIQSQGQSDEGAIPVQLRQVVNEGLGVSDRCVSCHVAMGPGEQSVRGGEVLAPHKPVVHDPAEYGCTVCHGGQGLATEKDDAHGRVHFWPEPMLQESFSYAGCGTCHIALGVPEKTQLQRATLAFERLDCLACHRVDGRGGTVRPDGGGMEGPDLSGASLSGYDRDWYAKHLIKSRTEPAGPWTKTFQPVSEPDLKLLGAYLETRVAAPDLVQAKSVFLSTGCLGCHQVSGVGGDDGPDLSIAGFKDPGQVSFEHVPGSRVMENWLAEHFRAPASVVIGSQMPPAPLAEREIRQLTLFTQSLRRKELRDAFVPRDRVKATKFGEREFASDGATVYGAFCAGCHGMDGLGRRAPGLAAFPSVANPDFLALVSDAFLTESVTRGRPGRRMPGWLREGGLTKDEIDAVVSHLRTIGGTRQEPDPRPARWVTASPDAGERIFESVCSGCHGGQGQGAEGPSLANPVLLETATDTYLTETIGRGRRGTAMPGFHSPSPVYPALTQDDIASVVAHLRSLGGKK